jgi:signal transduction histidine kinase
VGDPVAKAVFGLLFEHSPDAAFVVSLATGRILSANGGTATLLFRDVDSLIGMELGALAFDPERDLFAPGHYEDVGLRRGDDYPVYVQLQVAHVTLPEHGTVVAYMARDTSERRLLETELLAKHSALFTAYAELERAHAELAAAQRALEGRNREVALLAWRAAMGELVAGIAHHLNNPVGALASTVRRVVTVANSSTGPERDEMLRLLKRTSQLVERIEASVVSIIEATTQGQGRRRSNSTVPPELANVAATFVDRLSPPKETP